MPNKGEQGGSTFEAPGKNFACASKKDHHMDPPIILSNLQAG